MQTIVIMQETKQILSADMYLTCTVHMAKEWLNIQQLNFPLLKTVLL